MDILSLLTLPCFFCILPLFFLLFFGGVVGILYRLSLLFDVAEAIERA